MILALDPGDKKTGWVLVENDLSGIVKFGKSDNEELAQTMSDLCASRYPIDHVACEMIASYGMAVGKNVFETCVWIGRYCWHCRSLWGKEPKMIYRIEEKTEICHNSKAKDSNIRRALIDRFAKHDLKNGKGTKRDPDYFYGMAADAWSAFAVSVVYHDKYMSPTL